MGASEKSAAAWHPGPGPAVDRAPRDLVLTARTHTPRHRPVLAAVLGVVLVAVALVLVRAGLPWVALAWLVVVFLWLAWRCTWTGAAWSARRAYRRRMTVAGWCWYCHGPHLGRRCPERRTR